MASSVPTTEFTLPQNSYAAFDAISLRNLIIQRLNEQGVFTDQNYIGSNLASIIDIISFAYNTLIFYLNKTSTESNFSEAQLYENINRIVKLLGYKPVGYQTSTLVYNVSAISKLSTNITYNSSSDLASGQSYTIPRYSYINVGGLSFSFTEDITFSVPVAGVNELSDLSNRKLLYQGVYKENQIYTAQGNANEIVTIASTNAKIDHFNIDVYVYEQTKGSWVEYKNVPNLYTERPFARVFEKRLNSDQAYEITFGDGLNGRQLQSGDLVAIYYLESNGESGVIGPNSLKGNIGRIVFSGVKFNEILTSLNVENFSYINSAQFSNNFSFSNSVGSTLPKEIESVESIKKNAPSNFKSQYRLVTKSDFESFVATNFSNFISDVKVFSNWDYTGKYLKYFNDINISPTGYRQILLNQVLYSDSCNFNNIYICGLPRVSPGSSLKYLLPAQKDAILSNILPLKMLTTEVLFLDPVYKALSFGTKTNIDPNVDDRDLNYLQIIKSETSNRSAKSIANDAKLVFERYFNPANIKLGQTIQHSSIVNELLSISGVSKIQTTRIDTKEVYNGLSFLLWNPMYPTQDKEILVTDTPALPFDYVYFDNLASIFSKIKVIENQSFV
jgi:hypothetical protein